VVAFLDIVGPELNRTYDVKSDATPQLNHLLRQALLSCSGGVRLDEEANGPLQLLHVDVSKAAGEEAATCQWTVLLECRALGTGQHTVTQTKKRSCAGWSDDR
jgi:hypothetical protein